jgi:adenylyltransferase/sulfurtransferase
MATLTDVKSSEAKSPEANSPGPQSAPVLSNDEILRYSRHLIMPEVGMEGQQ